MVNKKSKKGLPKFLLLIVLSAIIFTGLIGAITFQQIAPTTNPFVTPLPNVTISTGVNCPDGCSSFTHSWNGTNTTLYDNSLVLFYNFDNRSELGENDTIVRDISMYGNNGTVVGGENITWGAGYGKYGGAFNFSGNKNYIYKSDTNVLDINHSTISFWIINHGSANSFDIIKKWGTQRSFGFFTENSGYISFSVSSNGSFITDVCSKKITGNVNITDGIWHFITSSYDGSSLNLYIDGVLNNNVSWTKGIHSGNEVLYIGNAGLTINYLNGSIDDVMIWNESKSSEFIEELYNSQITKFNSSYLEYNNTINSPALFTDYFLCSTNSTGNSFCTSTQSIRGIFNVKSNFSNSVGLVNSDFYGIVDEFLVLSGSSYSNLAPDCTHFTQSIDYERNKNLIFDAGMKYIRLYLYDADDYSLSEGVYNQTKIKELMDEAEVVVENGGRIILPIFQTKLMPTWLQDRTSYCNSDNWYSCPATNNTKFAILTAYILNNITTVIPQDKIDLEVMNEPWATNWWLNNLSRDHITKATEYVKLYNETYNYIKPRFPNVSIISGIGTKLDSPNMLFTFISNMSDGGLYADGISIHPYGYLRVNGLEQYEAVKNLTEMCDSYGVDCGKIILTEWNVGDDWLKNQSSLSEQYENSVATSYLSLLNYRPNVSNTFFQWSKYLSYNDCEAQFAEYPTKYPMFNEIDNTLASSYNATKNFAHLCPAGATVYVSSNDDSSIKQVSCKKGNMYSLIVINTDTNAKNITVNMTNNTNSKMFPYTSIMNYETGASIPVSTSGIVQLNVLDSYEILYLTSGDEDGADLRGVFKLNEGSGNTIYDSLQNLSNGLKNGATWINDSILITLSAVQYTIDLVTGLLTLDTDYLYEYLFVDYDYNKVFGFHVSILGVIAGFLMIIVLGVGIIYVVKYFKNIKELE